jgi:hypothetical protein
MFVDNTDKERMDAQLYYATAEEEVAPYANCYKVLKIVLVAV